MRLSHLDGRRRARHPAAAGQESLAPSASNPRGTGAFCRTCCSIDAADMV